MSGLCRRLVDPREKHMTAIRYSLGTSAQYIAETMAKKFANIGGACPGLLHAGMGRWLDNCQMSFDLMRVQILFSSS